MDGKLEDARAAADGRRRARERIAKNHYGHARATTRDGRTREAAQPYLRGGEAAPLSDAALSEKFMANAAFGGWSGERARGLADYCGRIFEERDLKGLRKWRG